jgi:manganese/zinc/iron transport system ATP- binding protein
VGADIRTLRAGDAIEDSPFAVRGLTVAYRGKPVLFGLDVVAPDGVMAAIIGPNGAGKSTLLKAALGLIPRVSGDVTMYGAPLEEMRRRVAYVPQRASVDWDFPASVRDVVMMGLQAEIGWLRWPRASHKARVTHALEAVGMAEFSKRQIGQLSGGQRQRVFLARALVQNPDMYLLDEPLAGVDAATERTIMDVLRAENANGKTVIAVHHDLATAPVYFDWALVLNVTKIAAGPIRTTLTPDILRRAYGGRANIVGDAEDLAAALASAGA